MTIDQFRGEPDLRARMRELFDDPVFAQALVLLKDANPVIDPALDALPIVSVRALSKIAGHQGCLEMLLSLSEPMSPVRDEPKPDYGTGIARDDF